MGIKTLQDLKDQYPNSQGLSDSDLVERYAADKGINPKAAKLFLGVRSAPPPAPVEESTSDVARAVSSYKDQMIGLGAGLGAMAADTVGATETRDRLFGEYQERMKSMEEAQRPQYQLDYLTEQGGIGDWVDAAQYYGTTFGLNVLGGGIAGAVGKQIAKRGLSRAVKDATEGQLERAGKIGFYGGIGSQALGQEIGATYGQAGEERIREGGTLEDVDKSRALAFGALAGGLEFASDVVLLGAGRFLPKGVADGLGEWTSTGGRLSRAGKTGATGATVEGFTEPSQTILEDLGADSEIDFDDEDYQAKLKQAAFAGAMSGGVGGTVMGGVLPGRRAEDEDVDLDLTDGGETPPSQGVTFRTLQEGIEASLGISEDNRLQGEERSQYERDLAAAFDEPTDQRAPDSETQQEVVLTEGERLRRRAAQLQPEQDQDQEQESEPTGQVIQRTLQESIEASLGIDQQQLSKKERDKVTRELKAEFDRPSGVFIADRETQVEQELSVGELLELEAARRADAKTPEDQPIRSNLPILYENPQPFVIVVTPDGTATRQAIDPNTAEYEAVLDAAVTRLSNRARQQVQQIDTLTGEQESITPRTTREKLEEDTARAIAETRAREARGEFPLEAKWAREAGEQELLNDPIFQTDGGKAALESQKTSRGTPNRTLQQALENYRKTTTEGLRKTLGNAKTSEWKKGLVTEILNERGQRVTAPAQTGQQVTTTAPTTTAPTAPAPSQAKQQATTDVQSEVSQVLSQAEAGTQVAQQVEQDATSLSSRISQSLNDMENRVWTVVSEAFANDDAESVISLRGGTRTSGLSPTQIAKKMGLDSKQGRKDVNKALVGLRKKIEGDLGIDVQAALSTLNRQRRSVVETQLPEGDAELGAERITAEEGLPVRGQLVDEQEIESGGMTVRDADKGESQIGTMDATDSKRIDKLLAIPQVQARVKEIYEEDTGQSWDKLDTKQKRTWYKTLEDRQPEDNAEQRRIAEENARLAAEQTLNMQKIIRAFTDDPLGKNLVNFYNEKIAPTAVITGAEVNFEDLSDGHKLTIIQAAVEAGRVPQRVKAAMANAHRTIEREIADEQSSRTETAGQARTTNIGTTQDRPQVTDQRSEDVSTLSVEQQNAAQGKAEKLAAEGKIKRRGGRRVRKTPEGMAHENVDGRKPAVSVTTEEAKQVAARVKESRGWKERGWLLKVVDTFNDLPAVAREGQDPNTLMGLQTILRDKDGNPVINPETGQPALVAYVIADAHESVAELEDTIIHEAAGHVGTASYLGEDRVLTNASIFFGLGEDNFYEIARKFGVENELRSYEATFVANNYDYYVSRAMLFEEMMAFTMGKRNNAGILNAIKRYVGEIRQALRRMGFLESSKLGETEILALMHRAESAIQGAVSPPAFVVPTDAEIAALNIFEVGQEINLQAATDLGVVDMNTVAENGLAGLDMEAMYLQLLTNAVKSGRYKVTDNGDFAYDANAAASNKPVGMAKLRNASINREQADLSLMQRLASAVSSKVQETFPGVSQALERGKLGWLTLEQIAKSTGFTEVKDYVNAVHKVQRSAKEIMAKAHTVNKVWSALESSKPEQVREMNKLMVETTLAEFDPSTDRAITAEQRALKKRFDALDREVKALYENVRDQYVDHRNEKINILNDAILAAEAANNGKKLNELRGNLESMRKVKGPYFPLKRMGKYYVVGMSNEMQALINANKESPLTGADAAKLRSMKKDPKHYRVESFDSLKEANSRRDALQNSMGAAMRDMAVDFFQREAGSIPDIGRIEAYFANSDLSDSAKGKVRGILAHMYADMLPANASAKQQMKREGVAGASEDMRRVFSDSAVKDAHQISRMKHSAEVNDSLRSVQKLSGRGDLSASLVAQELTDRAELMYTQDASPIVDSLISASYFAHLGMSPAYILTNMSQVPMITLPWLAGRHSVGKIQSEVSKSLSDVTNIIKSNWDQDGWRMEFQWEGKVSRGEALMLEELLKRNKLDITLEHDLTSVAKGASNASGFSRNSELMQFVNTPVRITELANRGVTALTAYRLEAKRLKRAQASNKLSDQQIQARATEYAVDAVNETQLDYSGLNAARHMQTLGGSKTLAKLAFQFRKYQQGMLYLVFSNMKTAMVGATPQQRAEAARILTGLFVTTGVMGGLAGLPLAGTIAFIINSASDLAGDEEEPEDIQLAVRNALTDYFGDTELARAISQGLPTLIGIDVSKRVGMGDILFPVPYARKADNPRDTVAEMLIASLGAAPNYLINAMSAGEYIGDGEYTKAIEKVVPAKLFQNVLRAYRYSEAGMTDRSGEAILRPEQFDSVDLLMRAFGFSTTMESDYYTAYGRMQDIKSAISDKRNDLIRRYAQATLARDKDAVMEVDREIKAFNERNADRGPTVRITRQSLRRSIKYRASNRAERLESGLMGGRRYDPYLEDVRFATGG